MSDWPERCEFDHCGHEPSLRIEGRGGDAFYACICHATEDLWALKQAYERRLELEASGCHPKLAISRAIQETYGSE